MKHTAYHSYSLFLEASKLKDNGHGCSAVMTYWLSVEAFLNDYTERLMERIPIECQRQTAMSYVLPVLDGSHISSWLRLEIFHNLLTHSLPDTGAQPWQSAKLLHDIRNSIAHPRPTVHMFEGSGFQIDRGFENLKSHKNMIKRMKGVGLIENIDEKNCVELDWFQLISDPSVSLWADTVCRSFLTYLAGLIPESTGQAEFVRLTTQMPWDYSPN